MSNTVGKLHLHSCKMLIQFEGAHMLIPVALPHKGVIVVGRSTITYVNGTDISVSVGMTRTDITSSCVLENDPCRYILGDRNGNLSLLILSCENMGPRIISMVVERLGVSSIPECLASLSNGLVFIGSCFGDSQLVKLLSCVDDTGSYVQCLENFSNIGPIMDMCLMGTDRQEQSQVLFYIENTPAQPSIHTGRHLFWSVQRWFYLRYQEWHLYPRACISMTSILNYIA